jgi:hypothetical protein
VNTSLQVLDLDYNEIGDEGAAALAEARKVSAFTHRVLSFLRHLASATALPRQGVLDDFSFGSSNIPPGGNEYLMLFWKINIYCLCSPTKA